MKILNILFLFFLSFDGYCQPKTWVISKPNTFLIFDAIATLRSNNIVAVGYKSPSGADRDGFFISQYSSQGKEIWSKEITMSGIGGRGNIISVQELENNDLIICGNTNFPDNKPFIVILNENGILKSLIDLIPFQDWGILHSVQIVTDGLLITGIDANTGNLIVSKISLNGIMIWAKSIAVSPANPYDNSQIIEISPTESIVYGRYKEIATPSFFETHLLKFNSQSGQILASKTLTSKDTLFTESITQNNGELYLSGRNGYEGKKRPFLASFDLNLNLIEGEDFLANNAKNYTLYKTDFKLPNLSIGLFAEMPETVEHQNIGIANISKNVSESKFFSQIPFIIHHDTNNYLSIDNQGNIYQAGMGTGNLVAWGLVKTSMPEIDQNCKSLEVSFTRKNFNPVLSTFKSKITDFNFQTQFKSNLTTIDFKCDIIETCITCNPNITQKIEKAICERDSFVYKNKVYKKEGIYTDVVNFLNCTGKLTVDLKVSKTKKTEITNSLCAATPSIKIASKTYTKSGIYQDTLKSATGCDSVLTIHIKDLSDLSVNLGEDKEILEGDKVMLEAKTNYPDVIKNYVWLPQGTNACDTCSTIKVAPTQNQWYAIKVNKDGCVASDSILIKVLNQQQVYMPTAFSPNDDKNNDEYRPYCAETVARIESFQVFDRWGTLIYEASDVDPKATNLGWNGTYKEQPANPDVYVYAVRVRLRNGTIQKFLGDVKLFR